MRRTITALATIATLLVATPAMAADCTDGKGSVTNTTGETRDYYVQVYEGLAVHTLAPGETVVFNGGPDGPGHSWAVWLDSRDGPLVASGVFCVPEPPAEPEPEREIIDVDADTYNEWKDEHPEAEAEWRAGMDAWDSWAARFGAPHRKLGL